MTASTRRFSRSLTAGPTLQPPDQFPSRRNSLRSQDREVALEGMIPVAPQARVVAPCVAGGGGIRESRANTPGSLRVLVSRHGGGLWHGGDCETGSGSAAGPLPAGRSVGQRGDG